MKAIRFDRTSSTGVEYSSTKPPPPSSLRLQIVPHPQISHHGEVIVRVKATSVVRDNLSWPELFAQQPAYPGNDFAGVVVEVHPDETSFRLGDEVYGMVNAGRGGTWAEYVLAQSREVTMKPKCLSWEEAAALPLSALTADQALYERGGLGVRSGSEKHVLITGASGAVGIYLVQLAHAAGHRVVAATGSRARDESILRDLGAATVVHYDELSSVAPVDLIVDTRGGSILNACWNLVKRNGVLITIDSASWDFVAQHRRVDLAGENETVNACFFIVEPSSKSMKRISELILQGQIRVLVSQVMSLEHAGRAYEICQNRGSGRGRIVLTF